MGMSTGITSHPQTQAMARIAQNLVAHLATWHRNHRTRVHLAPLDDHHLVDIGLSRTQQSTECTKWFWQS